MSGGAMWLSLYKAAPAPEPRNPYVAPEHCPHPDACLRLPLKEPRSFSDRDASRRLQVQSYRQLMARQCACNDHCQETKI